MNSSHWRAFFENKYIGAWDFPPGKDAVLTIDKVERGDLKVPGRSQSNKKPVLYFRGTEKGFALNKTNCKTIANLYGNDTRAWVGKQIAVYATQTQFGDEKVDCLRIRPQIPRRRANGNGVSRTAATEAPPPEESSVSEPQIESENV